MKKKTIQALLFAVCLFGLRPAGAWWTVVYPKAAYEAEIPQETEKSGKSAEEKSGKSAEEKPGIRWKLAEWIAERFF